MSRTGALSSGLLLTSSRLQRNMAEIFEMSKMGNRLLENGLRLHGDYGS